MPDDMEEKLRKARERHGKEFRCNTQVKRTEPPSFILERLLRITALQQGKGQQYKLITNNMEGKSNERIREGNRKG